jgi:hypothetical protein
MAERQGTTFHLVKVWTRSVGTSYPERRELEN